MSNGTLGPRHLLGIASLGAGEVRELLRATRSYAESPSASARTPLSGRFIANLFFEPSTRTRLSFTVAARRLGADVLDLAGAASSVSKGETIADTARSAEALGVSAIVLRHSASGAAMIAAEAVSCPVINAGDGRHEHPTQALIDAFVVAEAFGRLDGLDLSGLRVGIVGDIANSRVARSDIAAFAALGAEVVCVGPELLAPRGLEEIGCRVAHDLDAEMPKFDAVQMLRVQRERGAEIGSIREYTERFALDERRAARLRDRCVVLHPGPMNREIEISSRIADSPRCLVWRQVAAGVAVRSAVLARCAGV